MARILVVDDQTAVRNAIKAMLEHHGYTVILAEGGRAALGAIEAFAFDAVVVDLIMPGMDGLETIKIFRDSAPRVPIIAMSGYAFRGGSSDRDFFRMALDLGAACCLQKPFRPRDLVDAIETCRASWSGRGSKVA
jgi:CheY-like chemotaxis protein